MIEDEFEEEPDLAGLSDAWRRGFFSGGLAKVAGELDANVGGDLVQRRHRTNETGEEISGASLAVFAGATGIPDGELVDLDAGDGFDLFSNEIG